MRGAIASRSSPAGKGVVSPGTKHDETIFLGDLMATCAEIIGQPLPDTAGEDSFSFLSVLRGSADAPPRPAVVHHSARGIFAVRDGRWKLIFGPGSGGWSYPKPGEEPPYALPVQLVRSGDRTLVNRKIWPTRTPKW